MKDFYRYHDDEHKPDWSLVPWGPLEGLVSVLQYGARKYDRESWRDLPNGKMRYWASAVRHLIAWRRGELLDKESGLPHLHHAICNVLFVAELEHGE